LVLVSFFYFYYIIAIGGSVYFNPKSSSCVFNVV
jgi:hypothetical protein